MNNARRPRGFTIVELLVVVGIISILMSLLLPAVNRVRLKGMQVKCAAQMRDIGMALMIYSNDNRGWLYPVGDFVPAAGNNPGYYKTLGTEAEWAAQYPNPPAPTDSEIHHGRFLRWPNYVDLGVTPRRWNPPMISCPCDDAPAEGHTYILNKHLATRVDRVVRAGGRVFGGRSSSDVVLMGEKRTESEDYYMGTKEDKDPTKSEFDIVEPYKHGVKLGSNYLYLDNSVRIVPPSEIEGGIDPWSVWNDNGDTGATPTPTPTP